MSLRGKTIQIRGTVEIYEPGASRKGFAGAHESTAALGMPEEGSRVRALYAHFKKFRWIGGSKKSSISS